MLKNILITGATSGIGRALAKCYAQQNPSGTHLILTGRNIERLNKIEQQCGAYGAKVTAKAIDVRNQKDMQDWLEMVDDKTPIDLVIANAGIATPEKTKQDVSDLFDTTVQGSRNTVYPILFRMMKRNKGQIALMSSLAAYKPMAEFPYYGKFKADIMRYGLNMREQLHRADKQTKVNVICPGFVGTPLEAAIEGPKPFKKDTTTAAQIIIKGLERNDAIITTVPKAIHYALRLMAHNKF